MKTVRVKFLDSKYRGQVAPWRYDTREENSKVYSYAWDGEVSTGDIALVHNGSELCLVRVVEVDEKWHDAAITKWLIYVATADEMERYRTRNNKIRRRKEIIRRLEELQSELDQSNRFKYLSTVNFEAHELLKELDSLVS